MKRLKAGAMYYALIVAVLMAVISSTVILYAYHNRKQSINLELHQRTVENVLSAINLLIAQPDEIQNNTEQTLNLFEDENQQVEVKRKYWGGFELVSATASYHGFVFTKSGLVGADLENVEREALYLADLNRPLSLCGKTEITGDVKIPQSGVKRAYIEGQSFVGDKLINGQITNSSKQMPVLNEIMITDNNAYLSGNNQAGDSIVGLEVLEQDTIIHSFHKPTLVIRADNITLLKGVYRGNIRFVATNSILVSSDVEINDVLLYAPDIVIENGFHGTLQAFASDSLVLEEKSVLYYPSLLAVINNAGNGKLFIQEKSKVSGVVFMYQEQAVLKQENYLVIDKDVDVVGQVYSNGAIDLKGNIVGGLIAKKFVLKTPSSVYENHLLNAQINGVNLPDYFVGVDLLKDNDARMLAKWIE